MAWLSSVSIVVMITDDVESIRIDIWGYSQEINSNRSLSDIDTNFTLMHYIRGFIYRGTCL